MVLERHTGDACTKEYLSMGQTTWMGPTWPLNWQKINQTTMNPTRQDSSWKLGQKTPHEYICILCWILFLWFLPYHRLCCLLPLVMLERDSVYCLFGLHLLFPWFILRGLPMKDCVWWWFLSIFCCDAWCYHICWLCMKLSPVLSFLENGISQYLRLRSSRYSSVLWLSSRIKMALCRTLSLLLLRWLSM